MTVRRTTNRQVERLAELAAQGMTRAEAGREMGRSHVWVQQYEQPGMFLERGRVGLQRTLERTGHPAPDIIATGRLLTMLERMRQR
jgi:hypothetical protein